MVLGLYFSTLQDKIPEKKTSYPSLLKHCQVATSQSNTHLGTTVRQCWPVVTRGSSSKSLKLLYSHMFLLLKERDGKKGNCFQKSELQAATDTNSLTGATSQVMTMLVECGAEDWGRS